MSHARRLDARRCPGKRRNRKTGTAARKPRRAAAAMLRSSAKRSRNRGCGQQIRGEKLAPSALLLTSIDAISGQIGFEIYGPGKVNKNRAGGRAGKQGGHQALRGRGGKSVARSDRHRLRVRGLQLIAFHLYDTAHDVKVGMVENNGSVAVAVGLGRSELRRLGFWNILRRRSGSGRMNF